MIIVHEGLGEEASRLARTFREVYGLDSQLIDRDLEGAFVKVSELEGFWAYDYYLEKALKEFGNKKVMVITPRDIYAGTSKDDDWIFGYCADKATLVSTARMKGQDSRPRTTLEVPNEKYMRRLEAVAVHEIGHKVVRSPHLEMATWVNDRTGHELTLGPHCTDNTCVLYEIVDIRAPPKEEGHMRLGSKKKYDAGLDDVLERMVPTWFCETCLPTIQIDETYK
ncbi:MAG: hypothetical protein ABIA93_04950 [Candidatus Woesearchaeota archaeon]